MEKMQAFLTRLTLITKLKAAEQTRKDPREATEDPRDLKDHQQPPNVFKRQWTPISKQNPIWKEYTRVLRELRDEAEIKKQQLSACSNCFTLFTPNFPPEYNLHEPSASFKKATHMKTIKRCDVEVLLAEPDAMTPRTFQYKALVALAKESGAYKKEEGVEYIKLLRVKRAVRPHRGQAVYEKYEICENNAAEFSLEITSEQCQRTGSLAEGILKLVEEYWPFKQDALQVTIHVELYQTDTLRRRADASLEQASRTCT